jgi:hypothetical protein
MRCDCVVLMALLVGTTTLHAKNVDLVREGQPRAEIVVAESPEQSVRFFARSSRFGVLRSGCPL